MKSYKRVGEILLAIFLLLVGYFLYKLGMNIRHDVPIIKGLITEDDVEVKDINKNQGIYQDIYSVATFTEKIRNLQTIITYPVGRDDILASLKTDYEKFKLENKEEINATNTPDGISGVQDTHFSYEVNYRELGTSSELSLNKNLDLRSFIFTYYKYVAGAAHGESGMWSYNYIGNKKINSIYDMYINEQKIGEIKSKTELYKMLHDEAKAQIINDLADNITDMKWIEEGLSYSATNTINYDIWWIKGDNLYIYIAPYQIGPYSYGDRTVVMPSPTHPIP